METKKILLGLMTSVVLLSVATPIFANADVLTDNTPQVSTTEEYTPTNFVIYGDTLSTTISENMVATDYILTQKQQEIANSISNFYSVDTTGKVQFDASVNDLTTLGLSEGDANAIILDAKANQMNPLRTRGFVGLHINLGTQVRKMSSWAAGVYVTGYVGWYLKVFATTPVSAGVVAIISAGIGGAVGYAVSHGIKRVDVGVNIPFAAFSYTVTTP